MDWNDVINQLMPTIITVLCTILTAVGTYIGNSIKNAYVKRANTETAKAVVNDVVKFVQQVYVDLDGPTKYKKALTEASAILQGKGINITETEINMLIESAVYGIKQAMNEQQLQAKLAQDEVKLIEETKTKK